MVKNVYTGQTPFKEELTKARDIFPDKVTDIHIGKRRISSGRSCSQIGNSV